MHAFKMLSILTSESLLEIVITLKIIIIWLVVPYPRQTTGTHSQQQVGTNEQVLALFDSTPVIKRSHVSKFKPA